jgi:hypothetical protein
MYKFAHVSDFSHSIFLNQSFSKNHHDFEYAKTTASFFISNHKSFQIQFHSFDAYKHFNNFHFFHFISVSLNAYPHKIVHSSSKTLYELNISVFFSSSLFFHFFSDIFLSYINSNIALFSSFLYFALSKSINIVHDQNHSNSFFRPDRLVIAILDIQTSINELIICIFFIIPQSTFIYLSSQFKTCSNFFLVIKVIVSIFVLFNHHVQVKKIILEIILVYFSAIFLTISSAFIFNILSFHNSTQTKGIKLILFLSKDFKIFLGIQTSQSHCCFIH